MRHTILTTICLSIALLVALGMWVIVMVLIWILSGLYLDALTAIVELAQLS